ncbi:class I SAM-dependent methyltransferase [Candidatus Falkowbacteria bacterium]|nr:class I SAM-dependent methyltransferase [Candidatus Falkowbacteria bacterium]
MAVNTRIYDKHFFENTIKFEGPSAKAVVDILMRHFNPKSVVDIGCGAGIYLQEFERHEVAIEGYDGSPAAAEESLVGDRLKIHDLTTPLLLSRKFDLVLCVEVAEHLEKEFADVLVDTLCRLGDILVFTAATPGQGPESIGHINEQPHEYWIDKFSERGLVYDARITEIIKEEMVSSDVVWWVSKNLMIFKK